MAGVRTIAVTSQKGGVGKTTTVANLGAALAQRGLNVCLIDLDPQAHLTLHCGVDPTGLKASMYDVLTADMPLEQAIVRVEERLALVPSVIDLAAAEVELAGAVGREQILRDRFAGLRYDLVMVDCPPSLGLLTLNSLAAVEEVLIPLQPHFLALQGLGKLLETVALVRRRINPRLHVAGVVFCMFESATRLAAEVVQDVEKFLAAARGSQAPWANARIFDTRIRRNIKLAECPSFGTTIGHYDPSSHGAKDYDALAEEFLSAGARAPDVESRAGELAPQPVAASTPTGGAAPAPVACQPAAAPGLALADRPSGGSPEVATAAPTGAIQPDAGLEKPAP